MSLESEVVRQGRARIWLVSPAIATAIFFVAQFLLAALSGHPTQKLKAASAEAPSPIPVAVRVVADIRSFDADRRPAAKVPASETELIELFKKHGAVVFLPSEVEAVGTVEKKFAAEEVGVIKVDSKQAPH